jgi:hypothetical protein
MEEANGFCFFWCYAAAATQLARQLHRSHPIALPHSICHHRAVLKGGPETSILDDLRLANVIETLAFQQTEVWYQKNST